MMAENEKPKPKPQPPSHPTIYGYRRKDNCADSREVQKPRRHRTEMRLQARLRRTMASLITEAEMIEALQGRVSAQARIIKAKDDRIKELEDALNAAPVLGVTEQSMDRWWNGIALHALAGEGINRQ